MNIDIDEKEARVLLNALRMYRALLQEEAEELAALEATKTKRKTYPPPLDHCCCIDFPEKKPEIPYYRDDKFCIQLKDKLKMHQMQFPLDEHNINRQYGYDKKIGYEGAKWAETLASVGLPSDVEP
jgi:hypothetical protein